MSRLATKQQLRGSLTRWMLVAVPAIALLGFLSGQLSGSGADNPWFAALTKPALFPPPIAFPIVWTALYILMGVALALVLAARGARWRRWALVAFAVQFALNLAWSPIFFGAGEMRMALGVIVAMVVATLVTIVLFRRVRPLAAWLMVPYLAWILFASVLNWQFIAANPGADGKQVVAAQQRVTF
ncbi:MAG: tryptophan-rich sensory protein [Citromicrobium sp.]|nr:MAG: tryptophan-rich sensory protein [Citromicrobium sp.]